MGTFWANFNSECKRKGVTQVNAVEAIGLTHGALKNWRKGSLPTADTLIKLADYFGITSDELLTGVKREDVMTGEAAPVLPLTDEETAVIVALRHQPEMLPAVRRLLGMPEKS